MRSSKSRSRHKTNRSRTLGNVVNRVFDSSGPDGKVRGTPQQIIEKYQSLARDAQLSGDRVAEQSFLQHAEHYTRMLGEAQREQAERQAQQARQEEQQRIRREEADRENRRVRAEHSEVRRDDRDANPAADERGDRSDGQQEQRYSAENSGLPREEVRPSQPVVNEPQQAASQTEAPAQAEPAAKDTPEHTAEKPARAPRVSKPRAPRRRKVGENAELQSQPDLPLAEASADAPAPKKPRAPRRTKPKVEEEATPQG